MAEQSALQQYIQSLAGVQTKAQAPASGAANNGNPNTVYNNSAWGYGGPPTQNADGSGWSVNQYSRPPTVTLGGWQPPGGWTQAPAGPVVPINNVPLPTGGGYTPPNTTPDPDVTGDPPRDTGGGSNITPRPNGGGGGIYGGIRGGRPGGGVSLPGVSATNYTHTVPRGEGGGFGSLINQIGNISWQGVLDAFLPGDLYDSQSGTWDITNMAAAALNQIFPGLGTAAQWAVNHGLLGQTLQDFAFDESYGQFEARQANNLAQLTGDVSNLMEDRTSRAVLDRAAGSGLGAFNPTGRGWNSGFNQGWGMGQINPITGGNVGLGNSAFDNQYSGSINDRMNNWGVGGRGGRDSRSGNSTGSGVIAEGVAAQDMVERMQINNWLNGMSQQARDAIARMFEGEEQ